MKKTILLNLDERLYEEMEKNRAGSGMNRQEFIRTAIWLECIGLEKQRLEKEYEEKKFLYPKDNKKSYI